MGRPARHRTTIRIATTAGSLSLAGFALGAAVAPAAFADTAPLPAPTLPSASPLPDPDVSGTVDSTTKTVTDTVDTVSSTGGVPDPTPTDVPNKLPGAGKTSNDGGEGGRTDPGGVVDKVGSLLQGHSGGHASQPTRRTGTHTRPLATTPAVTLGDLPALHGWGVPNATVRTPRVAGTAPVAPVTTPSHTSIASAAFDGLSSAVSLFRRITTIAATLLLGLLAAAHVRSAQIRSRCESGA